MANLSKKTVDRRPFEDSRQQTENLPEGQTIREAGLNLFSVFSFQFSGPARAIGEIFFEKTIIAHAVVQVLIVPFDIPVTSPAFEVLLSCHPKIRTNSLGVTIFIPWNSFKTNRSLSPLTIYSHSPSTAHSST